MALSSSSAPRRPLYLLIGEDPFRARLRLAELVSALAGGGSTEASDLAAWPRPTLGQLLGVTCLGCELRQSLENRA